MNAPIPQPTTPGLDQTTEATLSDRAFVALQRVLPTRAISLAMYKLAQNRNPALSQAVIRGFASRYRIDMSQALNENLADYSSFANFFTRELKPGLRPLPKDPTALASPVDGTFSQCAPLSGGRIIQAKGVDYSAAELLGDVQAADEFEGGSFATIYLSPRDYHRVHMPLAGKLRQWIYVPGRLFSVNPATVRALDGVFIRNERLTAIFDTAYGPMALVLVGAMCVGGLETVWTGPVTPPHLRRNKASVYLPMQPVELDRGAEMGRFNLGSTVIVLLPRGVAEWGTRCTPGSTVRMGEAIARLRTPAGA